MDAVKFLKESRRMCEKLKCSDCPVSHYLNKMGKWCDDLKKNHPEQYAEIVEKWSAEHPVKTRQSELLNVFPDAEIMENGAIQICPKLIEKSKEFNCRMSCDDCREKYWLAEVE